MKGAPCITSSLGADLSRMAFAHGIMMHHFWDDRHPRGQGAISGDEFGRMLEWLNPDRILPAAEWMERAEQGTLRPNDLCLTFDDALRCQYDIAVPVLKKYGLTAFWFVYSSVFQGGVEPLEVFRYFRTVAFPDIEAFYRAFDAAVLDSSYADLVQKADSVTDYYRHLAEFEHYTLTDRRFRYLRDYILGATAYNTVMWQMIRQSGWESRIPPDLLWMNDASLIELASDGHVIGLHSFSHPMALADLSVEEQRLEYARNVAHLQTCLGDLPVAMSHPCNSYNADTLRILRDMNIRIGFRSNMARPDLGLLEMPRRDHANVMTEMNLR